MNQISLYAVKEDGTKIVTKLFAPLFRTFAPAFADRAEEIRISVHLKKVTVQASYNREGKTAELNLDEKVEWKYEYLDAMMRIRILSGLSIAAHEKQTGKMFIKYGDSKLTTAELIIYG
jgi:hypothetical protein